MRTWNLAVACLAIMSLQSNAAMPVIQLKTPNQVAPKSQAINYSLEELAERPELIDELNLSDEQRRDLMQMIIINAEQKGQTGTQNEDEGLVHQVQLFNFPGFGSSNYGGGFLQPRQSYTPPPQSPYYDSGAGLECPANGKRAKMPTPPYEPATVFSPEDMSNANDWKVKNFDLVVVINKAEYGQDIRVWRRLKPQDKLLTLVKDGRASGWKVSTGREHAEISLCDAQDLGVAVDPGHAPKTSYWSQTPTGYYIPDYLDIDHVSSDWEGSAMDHAVFFDSARGIATHRVPSGSEGRLGSRASGACVRMFQNQARELFWMVRATGGPVSQSELAQNDFGHCYNKKTPEEKQDCIARAKERRKSLNFANEFEVAKVSGLAPYEEWQQVPQITREGKCRFPGATEGTTIIDDCSKEGALTRKGFRTLYVVENRFIAKPVPQKKQAPSVSTKTTKAKTAAR